MFFHAWQHFHLDLVPEVGGIVEVNFTFSSQWNQYIFFQLQHP
jgi:hypothetical protein